MVVMFEDEGTWVVGHETFREKEREREKFYGVKGEKEEKEKKWFNKQCTNSISV